MTQQAQDAPGRLRLNVFAERDREALAIVDPAGRKWSRGEVALASNEFAHALRAQGFGRGSVMALVAPNDAKFIIAYLAATQIGMYVVPVNWHLAATEIRYILEDCHADLLVVHGRFRSLLESVLAPMAPRKFPGVCLDGAIPDFVVFEDFIKGASSASVCEPIQGRVLSYTSATTGRPKGVLLPLDDARRVLDLAIASRIAAGTLPEAHVQLCVAMLYHGAPLEGVVVSLHMGHVVVLLDRFEPEVILRTIQQYGVTLAYVAPSAFSGLLGLDEATRQRYSTASLQKVLHAGAPCLPEVKRQIMAWWGPILWEAYGSTEGSGTIASPEDWLRFPGTVGKAMPGTSLRIVGDDDSDAPVGTIGTVYLTRYCGDRFEYLNDPGKTRTCHRGEFFTVGDEGYLNSEGFLFLAGRKTDVINLGGTKVYPAELEQVLAEHPLVADCAVLGVPDPRLGEAILAVICPASGAPEPGSLRRTLVRYLAERVSIAKIPKHFEFTTAIPRDASGKTQRARLRDRHVSRTGIQRPV